MIQMTWWFFWFALLVVATGTAFVSYWIGVSAGERNKRPIAKPPNTWNNVRVVDETPIAKFGQQVNEVGKALGQPYSSE